MGQKPFTERRRHPRIEKSVPVKVCLPGSDFVTATRDLSCSGACCRFDRFLEPMTRLEITLLLPVQKGGKVVTRKIVCRGVVVRTENIPDGLGFFTAIFFNEIHPKDKRLLSEYVDTVLHRAGASSGMELSRNLN